MGGPLSGYRIIDFTRAIAGPSCTQMLGDMGAEVIKIEAPGEPQGAELTAGPNIHGQGFHYVSFNRNKKSISLDVGTASGKQVVYDLVKISDVVVDNFRPGVMERLGADYETLKKINPKIISCGISGFGANGPRMYQPAYDVVMLGMAGALMETEPGAYPSRPSFPAGDILPGLYAAVAICAALACRECTGKGQKIDVAMLDSILAAMTYEFSYYFLSGIVPERPEHSGHLASTPWGVYKCKEGYVVICNTWPKIARVIGADWMIDDPRFKTPNLRVQNRRAFNQAIEAALASAPAEDWLEIFKVEDCIAGPINPLDIVAADPQVEARNMILKLPHPLGGEVKLIGTPLKLAGMEEDKFTAPPLKGQHNDEILKSLLKYSEEKIKKLREDEAKHTAELTASLTKTRGDAAVAANLQRDAQQGKK